MVFVKIQTHKKKQKDLATRPNSPLSPPLKTKKNIIKKTLFFLFFVVVAKSH